MRSRLIKGKEYSYMDKKATFVGYDEDGDLIFESHGKCICFPDNKSIEFKEL